MKKEIHTAFGRSSKHKSDVRVIFPRIGNEIVARAFQGVQKQDAITEGLTDDGLCRWEDLSDVLQGVKEYVTGSSNDFLNVVGMIESSGIKLSNHREYEQTLTATSNDIERFTEELVELEQAILANHGYVRTPADHSKYHGFFEKIKSFHAFFSGVIQHNMIALTSYSLEVRQKAKELELAKQAEQATPETQPKETNHE